MNGRSWVLFASLVAATLACKRENKTDDWKPSPYVPSEAQKFASSLDLKTVVDHEPTKLKPPVLVYEPTRGGLWDSLKLTRFEHVGGKNLSVDVKYATASMKEAATYVYLEEVQEKAGVYSNGATGTRMSWRAHFVDVATHEILGEKKFEGSDPPPSVGSGQYATGNLPSSDDLWKYIDPLVAAP
jgi:hypothetical protein